MLLRIAVLLGPAQAVPRKLTIFVSGRHDEIPHLITTRIFAAPKWQVNIPVENPPRRSRSVRWRRDQQSGHVGSLATRVVCTPPWRGSSCLLQHGGALPRDQSWDLQRVVMNARELEELGDLVHDLRFAEQTRRAVAKPP